MDGSIVAVPGQAPDHRLGARTSAAVEPQDRPPLAAPLPRRALHRDSSGGPCAHQREQRARSRRRSRTRSCGPGPRRGSPRTLSTASASAAPVQAGPASFAGQAAVDDLRLAADDAVDPERVGERLDLVTGWPTTSAPPCGPLRRCAATSSRASGYTRSAIFRPNLAAALQRARRPPRPAIAATSAATALVRVQVAGVRRRARSAAHRGRGRPGPRRRADALAVQRRRRSPRRRRRRRRRSAVPGARTRWRRGSRGVRRCAHGRRV